MLHMLFKERIKMFDDVIKQMIGLLKKTDIRTHETELITLKKEGEQNFKDIKNGVVSALPTKIDHILLAHSILFFSLADVKVDLNNSELEGKSFAYRAKKIRVSNDEDEIFKSCYRILIVLRNAVVHNKNEIDPNNKNISLSYEFNSTNFKLNITYKGLELIYSYLLEVHKLNGYPSSYHQALARSLYDNILEQINCFHDSIEDGELWEGNTSGIRLNRVRRFRVPEATFKIENNTLTICSDFNIESPQVDGSDGIDYEVEYEGHSYMIPCEILKDDYSIKTEDLEMWRK